MFFIYLFFILMFFNSSSMIFCWILLELNMILFLFIMANFNNYNLNNNTNNSSLNTNFFYMVIQSLGSFIFLFSINMTVFMDENIIEFLLLISMVLKMGLFPLHFWMYEISNYLNNLNFFLLMSFQKIPSLIIFFNTNFNLVLPILVLSAVSGSILIYFSKCYTELIISSSIFNSFWMFIFLVMNVKIFFLFIFNFMIVTFFLTKDKMKTSTSSTIYKNNIFMMINLMFLMGLPPMSMFFLKFYAMNLFMNSMNMTIILSLWASVLISTFSYFKFFFMEIFTSKTIYIYYNGKYFSSMLVFVFMSIFLMF